METDCISHAAEESNEHFFFSLDFMERVCSRLEHMCKFDSECSRECDLRINLNKLLFKQEQIRVISLFDEIIHCV